MTSATPEPAGPLALHIGHLHHVGKHDAGHRVRSLIRRLALDPASSAWRLAAVAGGYAYEIQEGGAGKAYLPGLISRLRDAPNAPIHLRAGNRVVRVSGPVETIQSVVLPEAEQPEVDAIPARGRLRAFEPDTTRALIASAVFFSAAAIAFLTAVLITTAASEHGWRLSQSVAGRNVAQMPLSHFPDQPPAGHYVARVQYVNGRWTVQTRSSSAPKPLRGLPDITVRRAPAGRKPAGGIPAGGTSAGRGQ